MTVRKSSNPPIGPEVMQIAWNCPGKNDFMYCVFNKCLLSDMGKAIVRKHLDNMNAQQVWEEFATHMTTSSKGKAEKHQLHTYVTTTVLDKSWPGTTEQVVLHFK